jgi:hypothetical protein
MKNGIIFLAILAMCSPIVTKHTSWDRYQKATFIQVLDQFRNFVQFDETQMIKICAAPNAFRSKIQISEQTEQITEDEYMVLETKYQNNLTKDKVREIFKNKLKYKEGEVLGWLCFQDNIYQELMSIKPKKEIEILYQFAGSTNAGDKPRLIFAVMGWIE